MQTVRKGCLLVSLWLGGGEREKKEEKEEEENDEEREGLRQ